MYNFKIADGNLWRKLQVLQSYKLIVPLPQDKYHSDCPFVVTREHGLTVQMFHEVVVSWFSTNMFGLTKL